MNLCTNYTEFLMNNYKKFIFIEGDFSRIQVHLIISIGANKDPLGKNGLSHLCEHIFLESVAEQYLILTEDNKYNYMGYTDYEFTVLKFVISNCPENMNYLLKVLNSHLNNCGVDTKYIEKCRLSVLEECEDRINHSVKSLKVNTFLTNNIVNYVPIGNIKQIYELNEKDIIEHLNQYASNTNIIIFSDAKIIDKNPNDLLFKLPNTITKCEINSKGNFEDRGQLLQLSNVPRNIKIYFKQQNKSLNSKEMVVLHLMEFFILQMLDKEIGSEYNLDITIKKKVITKEHSFLVIYVNGIYSKLDINIKKIINNLLEVHIMEHDLETLKNLFRNNIIQTQEINEACIHNNLNNYIRHNDLLCITAQHYKEIGLILNEITIEDMHNKLNGVFNNNYKILYD